MNREVKQVIVIRTDLNMRKGKFCAQASHGSISFITRKLQKDGKNIFKLKLSEAEQEWIESGFTKICLQVPTEKELLEIYNKAKEKGLEVHLIIDAGRTEFNGIPTKTTVCIGPDYSDKIDEITGDLKLL